MDAENNLVEEGTVQGQETTTVDGTDGEDLAAASCTAAKPESDDLNDDVETEQPKEQTDTVDSTNTAMEADASEDTSEQTTNSAKDSAQPDEYLYTKRDAFTSEIYKIQVTNLPKHFGFKELKKKLGHLEVQPVKMKVWNEICFLTFRSEEEREKALKVVNGFKWKGRDLKAVPARPAADPLIRKRKWDQERDKGSDWQQGKSEKRKRQEEEEEGLTDEDRLSNSVTPLWKLTYEEQLKKKQETMRGFFRKFHQQLEKNCADLRHWLHLARQKHGGLSCELQDIKPSPETEGYRNKCEFTIGPGVGSLGTVVGFRFGQYSQGTVHVGSPDNVKFVPESMKQAVKAFQSYLSNCQYGGFNPEDHTGHWRQMAVRTSRLGHIMVMLDFHPQALTQEEIDAEISRVRDYFSTGDGMSCSITSCYFRSHTEKMTGAATDSPYKLVFGEKNITETLLGMKFRISPNAFFQVNTAGAEVLYKQVADWCNVSPATTVLDVCCGTGTIGLTVAKSVESVVGIEMCAEAIEDAKVNAQINDISNVTYHCAKAEDVMKRVTRSVYGSSDVVAIVDPPRGGLHSSVVIAIRNCRSISRLVYVSCNVNGALNNLLDLVRPTSKRLKGDRFLPVKAVPVDLFPHTNHCELVMMFEREQSDEADS